MKKSYIISFVLLTAGFLLVSCNREMHNDREEMNREAVVKIFEIFDNGDINALDTLLAEDIIDHQLDTSVSKQTGREGVKEMFRMFHNSINNLKTTIHSIASTGDTVMVFTTITGTQTGDFMGMPSNNQQLNIPGTDVFVVENGKITEHWGFIDINAMMSMMQGAGKDMMMKKDTMIKKDQMMKKDTMMNKD